jgi:spore cortex biosynthesis protein YabQ
MYELSVFGGAGAAGVLIAFLYDLFRLKRRIIRTRPFLVHAEDILYWLCASVILFLFSYVLSSGETRVYFYVGAFIGALLYFSILSEPVLWLLSTTIKILVWPFCEIFRFLRPVFDIIHIRCRKLTGKLKSRASSELCRAVVNCHRLRNTFTKK